MKWPPNKTWHYQYAGHYSILSPSLSVSSPGHFHLSPLQFWGWERQFKNLKKFIWQCTRLVLLTCGGRNNGNNRKSAYLGKLIAMVYFRMTITLAIMNWDNPFKWQVKSLMAQKAAARRFSGIVFDSIPEVPSSSLPNEFKCGILIFHSLHSSSSLAMASHYRPLCIHRRNTKPTHFSWLLVCHTRHQCWREVEVGLVVISVVAKKALPSLVNNN